MALVLLLESTGGDCKMKQLKRLSLAALGLALLLPALPMQAAPGLLAQRRGGGRVRVFVGGGWGWGWGWTG